jgi:hypothetical protein
VADDVSLREYVDALFMEKEKALQAALLAQEKAVAAALESADKAITKAEANAEKWRENANEWRGAMSDRDRELPSRREVDAQYEALSKRLEAVEHWQTRDSGKSAGIGSSVGAVIGAVAIASGLITVIVVLANVLS